MDIRSHINSRLVRADSAPAKPLGHRSSHPQRVCRFERPAHGIVKTVGSQAEIGIVNRDRIDADPIRDGKRPVVGRNSGQNMPAMQLPGGGN